MISVEIYLKQRLPLTLELLWRLRSEAMVFSKPAGGFRHRLCFFFASQLDQALGQHLVDLDRKRRSRLFGRPFR